MARRINYQQQYLQNLHVYQTWLTYNLLHPAGIPSETRYSEVDPWYREDVCFSGKTVRYRVMGEHHGKTIIGVRYNAALINFTAISTNVSRGYYPEQHILQLPVPSLGVRSRFAGDVEPLDIVHKRNRFLLFSVIREFYSDFNLDTITPKAAWESDKTFQNRFNDCWNAYERYSTVFNLDWPPLPAFYRDTVMNRLKELVDKWTDPKATQRRERATARRAAIKALGLG